MLAFMQFTVRVGREEDARWFAIIRKLPGVMAYGDTRREAIARCQALALRVLAERVENGETAPLRSTVKFEAA